eukprot:12891130-Prorocentrum_lima.AAC.1
MGTLLPRQPPCLRPIRVTLLAMLPIPLGTRVEPIWPLRHLTLPSRGSQWFVWGQVDRRTRQMRIPTRSIVG